MAQFTVNAQPLRPVQELQVPGQVGRPLRRRHQQGRRAQAHHRGRRAPRGRRPEHRAASRPGRTQVRADHARARRHPRHRVRAVGQQGVELRRGPRARRSSLADFRKDIIIDVYNEAGQLALAYKRLPLLGLGVPGAARPRRQRQRGRDPDHQARERGLGARPRGGRAGRADLHRAAGVADGRHLRGPRARRHHRGR